MRGITGTRMPRTSWNHLRHFTFPCPPLAEQRAIAAVLDSIDEAIERTEAVITANEQLRESVREELLTRGIPGWHSQWKKVPRFGIIPTDWEIRRLGDITDIRGGVGFPLVRQGRQKGTYPFIKVSDLTLPGNEISVHHANNYVDVQDLLDLKVRPFSPGSVVFPKIGAAIATNKKRIITIPTLIDNNMMAVTVSAPHKCDDRYLFHWFRTVDLSCFANVSAVPSITTANMKRALFALPSLEEQQSIAHTLDSVDISVEASRRARDALNQLKESTAEALLTGTRRVLVGGGK